VAKQYTGWAYVSGSGNDVNADGPVGAVQYHADGAGSISGSKELLFVTSSSPYQLRLTGSLHVSGTITALNYDVVNHTVTYFSSSGDSKFGNSIDDLHEFTGSISACLGTASIAHLSGCSPIQVHAPISSSYNISASAFYGDGSNLTGITASAVNVADGPEYAIQFRRDSPVSGEISGSGALLFLTASSTLSLSSSLAISGTAAGFQSSEVYFGTPGGKIGQLLVEEDDGYLFVLKSSGAIDISGSEGVTVMLDVGTNLTVASDYTNTGLALTNMDDDVAIDIGHDGAISGSGDAYVGGKLYAYNNSADLWGGLDLNSVGITATGPIADATTVSGTYAQFTAVTASAIVGGSPLSISSSATTVTGSLAVSDLDEGGILFAGTDGELNTDVDSLQWSTEREYNGGYIGLVVSSSASGSAALGDGMFMLSDATDELVCLITADGAEFAVNLSGSGDLNIGGNATIGGNLAVDGNATIGNSTDDDVTWKGNNCDFSNSNKVWTLADNSDGFGDDGPLLIFTGSGGDLLKFSTSGSRKGVVFPTTFYPDSDDSVDIGDSTYRFRNLYLADTAVVAGVSASANVSASYFYGDGSNLTNLPGGGGGGIFTELGATTAATTSSVKIGTGSAPMITLDVHYTGSGSPVNLSNDTGGGEVVYFGTSSAPLSTGAVYFLNNQGGWQSVDSATTGSGHNQLLGVALGPKTALNGVLIKGYFDANTHYSGSFIKGGPVYIQSSSVGRTATGGGYLSGAAPSAADSYVRVVGYGTDTANVIYFNPDSTYVEIG